MNPANTAMPHRRNWSPWRLCLLCAVAAGCTADRAGGTAAPAGRGLAALESAALYTFTERELDLYLRQGPQQELPLTARVAHFAGKFVGQPYRLHLLGEYPVESHDPDPLYCLSASDCVTFVEHVYAMALARDWDSFHEHLMRLRYRDGQIGIRTRNHFTEADWNVNNAWLFDDVTGAVGGSGARPMTVVIDRAAFFRKLGVEFDREPQTFNTTYIPKSRALRREASLQTGDVIEFVRGSPDAPWIGHLGLCIRDGKRAMLIHSGEPAVSRLPLAEYLNGSKKTIGIKVLRPRNPHMMHDK